MICPLLTVTITLTYWTGKSTKSARREIFYCDETDLAKLAIWARIFVRRRPHRVNP